MRATRAHRDIFPMAGIVHRQSLSVGSNGTPLLSTTRVYNNLVLSLAPAKCSLRSQSAGSRWLRS